MCIFRDEWVSGGVSDLMEDKEEPREMFDKEDMTDMFSRAMLEKMQPQGEQNGVQDEFMRFIPFTEIPRAKYRCYVCTKLIGEAQYRLKTT